MFTAKDNKRRLVLPGRPSPGVLKLAAEFSKPPRNITRVQQSKRSSALSVPTRARIFESLCHRATVERAFAGRSQTGSGPNPRPPAIECGCRRKFLPLSRFMGPKPQNPKNKRPARRLFAKNSTNKIPSSVPLPILLRNPIPPNHGPAPVAPGRRNINRCCGPANVVQAAMKSTTSRCSRHPGSDPMRASHLFTEGCVAARS